MINYEQYARVVLQKGINLKKGQNLLISCNAGNYDLARSLATEAYTLGAGFVEISVQDNYITKARLAAQSGDELTYIPNYQIGKAHQLLSEDWARIRIDSTEEQDVLGDVDSDKLSLLSKASRTALRFVSTSMMNGEHSWCVICAPGPQWAKKVLGDKATTEELWDVLKPVLRLDREDPALAWEEHGHDLWNRCKILNEMKLDRLHFEAEGTDLIIGLNGIGRWHGGPGSLPDGRMVFNNLPTEEVFTTPDFTRCNGTVRTTKALKVLESPVEGAWFRFEEGKVVDFGADKGQDVLKQFLDMDEGARSLGEVALVDETSPIAASGLIFGSILYDENASCHIALGAGYPFCLELPPGTTGEETLKSYGCNSSLLHTDFMIGSPSLNVTGYDREGKAFSLIRSGRFVLA
ncbi:aminopeptidase [Oceanispirochaeta crateris]|uniref:Aminopeptidase n=1 Tax=Oceanispirochaeta crateris TaxID=2518645 RepID=A0A5C1QMZ8_9SPIO|nr:aminopeptidase [Oceanispirochaeta crateris]QEN08897.1 aminopeptidase [Oceanispirochaeta crateris]